MVVMPAGTYILGGYSNRFTSEFLPTGSTEWQAGPAIPSPGLAYGCAVAIDSTRFVVAGGKVFSPTDAVANVRVYDTASNAWIQFGKSLKPKKNFGRNWQDGLIEWLIPSVYLSTFMTSLDSTFLLFFGEALTPATALILTNMLQIFPEFHEQNYNATNLQKNVINHSLHQLEILQKLIQISKSGLPVPLSQDSTQKIFNFCHLAGLLETYPCGIL